MKKSSEKDAPFVFRLGSTTLVQSDIGQVSIDFQVGGRDYRWSQAHGLVRRDNGTDVAIPGTETEAWKDLELFLLLPPVLSAAVTLGAAVKHLEGTAPSYFATTKRAGGRKGVGGRTRARRKS